MAIPDSLKRSISDELLRMEEDCIHSGKSHFNASARWNRWNYWFGIPSVVLSTAAGTAFFKDYTLVAGIMASTVAILSGLMTFLKPAEKSNSHKNSGDQYLSLRNDSRVFREVSLLQDLAEGAAVEGMEGLTKRRNELNQASPLFSDRDFKRAKRGIDAGQARHAVDQKPR